MACLNEFGTDPARRVQRRPSVALLHYTGPPVVGGVEAVMNTQARLFASAGYPTTVVVGRGDARDLSGIANVKVIPDMDSEPPTVRPPAEAGKPEAMPPEFFARRDRLEHALEAGLHPAEVVIVHNVLTTHFNLPLTAAIHHLAELGRLPNVIAWCHDISRHVNPASSAPQRPGYPWDMLRRYRPDFTYVAVSTQRQRMLANVLGCPQGQIHVVPNGVDPSLLLGLSSVGAQLAEQFGLLSADLVILMPIRITRAKNIEFAMRVTAALKAAQVRLRLVITGPPDPHAPDREAYYAQLRALRHDLDLETEVVFASEGLAGREGALGLPPAVVAELFRMSDLMLMPSQREGFGMPVLEAGLVGQPVFVTAIPVVEELGEGLVQLIRPDETPQQIANRILIWAEQDPRHRLRQRARQAYTWSTIFSRDIEPLVASKVVAREGDVA